MQRYKIGLYVLALETYILEAVSPQEAYERAGFEPYTEPLALEKLCDMDGEGMTRDEFPEEPNWTRLFSLSFGPVDGINALRTVENLDTGERWDRWDGYWPPADVPGERLVGRYDAPSVSVPRLLAMESAIRSCREALRTVERLSHAPYSQRTTDEWSREYHKALRQRNESWRKLDTLLGDVPEDEAATIHG